MQDFHLLIERLKTTPRTGWVRSGIPKVESISDHMYRMSMLAMTLPDKLDIAGRSATIDRHRCIRMCLVHDLAESLVGDITPHCGISDGEKYSREKEAIEQITKRMIGPHQSVAAEEIYELWLEYEKYETNESIVVHDLDKYEMILQAFEYEARYPELNLQGFFDSTKDYFRTDLVKNWSLQLREKRMKRP